MQTDRQAISIMISFNAHHEMEGGGGGGGTEIYGQEQNTTSGTSLTQN